MIDIKRKLEKLECQVNPPQTWQGLLAALSDQELDDFILLSEAQCILSGATTADIEAVYIEATSAYDARLRSKEATTARDGARSRTVGKPIGKPLPRGRPRK